MMFFRCLLPRTALIFLSFASFSKGLLCNNTLAPAVIKGNKFFDSGTGTYIPIKGMDYYPRPNEGRLDKNGIDFFTEEFRGIWERDIPILKELGVNAVRLYAVDPSQDHDGFMCALDEAGIYAIVGLAATCENCAITDDDPPDCYPAALKERGQFIMGVFAKYPNLLAFSAGNEVNILSAGEPQRLGVCQKQFIRDMRKYVRNCRSSMRSVPIGVVIADVDRELNSIYYSCRSDPSDELENAEFVGINVYLHCNGGRTDPEEVVGFNNLRDDFQEFKVQVPVLLTEFGCLNPSFKDKEAYDRMYESQRNFLQVDRLFSPELVEAFAGGFVFEYVTEKNNWENTSPWPFTEYSSGNYGVGFFEPEDCNDIDKPCVYLPYPQYDSLQKKYLAVDNSFVPNFYLYEPDIVDVVECPADFPPLTSYEWPSESYDDLGCPEYGLGLSHIDIDCASSRAALGPGCLGSDGPNGDGGVNAQILPDMSGAGWELGLWMSGLCVLLVSFAIYP